MNQSGFGALDGSKAAPSYTFISDTDTGLYWVSSGIIGVVINGVEVSRFTSSGMTVPLGQGLGGAVTQLTDKTTTVVLSKMSGQITTVNTTLNAAAETGFTVTNTLVQTTDTIVLSLGSGATANSYLLGVDAVGAGSFHIMMTNVSGSNLSEALVINFRILRGVAN